MPADTTTGPLLLTLQGTGNNDNTWGVKANTNFSFLEQAITGYLPKAVSGGTVALTDDEQKNHYIVFTGALASNSTVTVSAEEKGWIVRNNTSNAFTVTIKTSAGTGIAVQQGEIAFLWCDGTDVVQIDPLSLAADKDLGGYKFTNIDDATARNHYSAIGQVADGVATWYGDTSGTDTYTLADNSFTPVTWVNGAVFRFRVADVNTGAVTLNPNSLGAKSVVTIDGSALSANDWPAGALIEVTYSSDLGKCVWNSGVGNGSVTNAKLSTMPAASIKANLTGSTAAPTDAAKADFTETDTALDDVIMFFDKSDSEIPKVSTKRQLVVPASVPHAIVSHTETSGTGGGDATSGSWRDRPLNTVIYDPDGIVTLTGTGITRRPQLIAGDYYVEWSCVFVNTNSTKTRLTNDAAGVLVSNNINMIAIGNATPLSTGSGFFTFSGVDAIQLEYRSEDTVASVGLGEPDSWSTETFAIMKIWRVA